jgi:hypothetical protein
MENDNLFGRDADEMVMAMNRKSVFEQIKNRVAVFLEKKANRILREEDRIKAIANIIEDTLQEK